MGMEHFQLYKPVRLSLHGDAPFGRGACERLAARYHAQQSEVLEATESHSPEQFLRLFLTAHGMAPVGNWQTHTYVRVTDSATGKDHFFLIPIPFELRRDRLGTHRPEPVARPAIRLEDGRLWVDEFQTPVRPQAIPYTTPFWYFHYDPNQEQRPFRSMTLNLKPSCPEKCVMCAGAKTGRVNNGMEGALAADQVLRNICAKHPETKDQMDNVAVVTGCFDSFEALSVHLKDVREAALRHASPTTFRVLEHNVATERQLELVVGELGYDVFITLECYDAELRRLALNGRVGRKGRDTREFLEMMRNYAHYLDARPELNRRVVHVTYLIGIDPLQTAETLFQEMSAINRGLKNVTVLPWLSVFTPYEISMRLIQHPEFSLEFLIRAQDLCRSYFPADLLASESGGTADGYARGLF